MKNKTYYCSVSNEPIPPERVEYLLTTNTNPDTWTLTKYSTVTKKLGIFIQPNDMGEHEFDSSTLLIVDKLYNDSVRSILRKEVHDSDLETEDEENED